MPKFVKTPLSACPLGDALRRGRLTVLSLVLIVSLAGPTGVQAQLAGDLNADYVVDFKDLWLFAWNWMDPVCLVSVCEADLDGADGVNMADFALLAKNWQIDEPHIVISEFMASNTNTLLDKDGSSSDWIEIYNPTDKTINLGGWYLTDSTANLTMWQFPAVELDPGEFLVVFASEKNLLDPNELHTNFELNRSGDYLALVAADGNTIAHEYAPEFPEQLTDVSYGLAQHATAIVPTSAISSYKVPTSSEASLGTDWADLDFDDSSWGTQPTTNLHFGDICGIKGLNYEYFEDYWSYLPNFDLLQPEYEGIVDTFDITPRQRNNYFGFRFTGFIEVPLNGVYTFYTASDEGSKLYISGALVVDNDYRHEMQERSGSIYLDAGMHPITVEYFEYEGDEGLIVSYEGPGIPKKTIIPYEVLCSGIVTNDMQSQMQYSNASLWTRIEFNLGEENDPSLFNMLIFRMKYEDGFVAYLNGEKVAWGNNPDPVGWNSTALSDRPIENSTVFEEINLMAFLPLLQTGGNVLAIHGLNDNKNNGEFRILPELVAAMNRAVPEYFTRPTPGTFNISGAKGVVEDVWFSTEGTIYNGPPDWHIDLTLSNGTEGAEIRYTLDGSLPTITHGLTYNPLTDPPLEIDKTTVVRAVAVKLGWLDSAVQTHTYFFLDSDVQNFSSNLPIAIVDTFGVGIGQPEHTLAFAGFIDTTTSGRARITDPVDFIGRAGINIRGKSSAGFPKKQYHLETWDEYDQDKDVSILGFPAESDWVLQGPYSDKSLMRNFLSYKWSNDVGRYAVRSRFIELFLNTEDEKISSSDYVGVYVFMERIKRSKDRVDIAKLDSTDNAEPDITGGYIIKKDKFDPGEPSFYTSSGQHLIYVEPQGTEITQAQADWIKGYLDEFELVLYGPNFTDPVDGYTKYIDVDSFVDHHIIVELTKNIDGFRLSTYMFKDRGGKLNMGPVWDYNLSLGNADYLQGWLPNGWYYSQLNNYDYPWWRRIFEDPEFRLRYADRWFGHRREPLATVLLLQTVDNVAALLNEAQARNFNRWPVLGIYVWPNWFIANTYQEEINWMKGWLGDRLTWMDTQIGTELAPAPPTFNQQGGQVNQGFNLTIAASSGTIYYTLDGSDPREPFSGNAVGTRYTHSITLNKSTRIKARALDGGVWSALNEAVFAIGPVVENLRITEIMYHPLFTGNINDPNKEYIELKNIGQDTLNLNLVRFTEGIHFTFPDIELDANECVVVVKDQSAFETKYGESVNTTGPYIGSLANNGERIKLEDAIGRTVLDFQYGDGWHPITDGDGFSLTIIDTGGGDRYGSSEGLVAHWKFDEGSGITAIDSAGTNNGTLNGDPTWTTGRIGGALSFSGDYVAVDPVVPLGGDTLTVQAWIRLDESAGATNPILTQFKPSMTNDGYYLYVSSGKPKFYVINGFSSSHATSLETIDTDQWYHVAGTNDGSRLKLYVNGQLMADVSSTGFTGVYDNSYARIGHRHNSSLYYTGLIDDVRIYDRAVSESEFQAIADPIGRWNLKDSWRASVYRNGSPGWDDSGILPNPGAVVINEVMSHSNAGPDWIELYNTTNEAINIGGWFLSDNDRDEPNLMKYRIPDGTTIGSNGYLVLYEDTNFNKSVDPCCLIPFALSENGEEACLSSHLDPNGMLTGYRDVEDFGASQTNVSFGRYYKSSTDNFNFVAMDYNTPDTNNAYPKVGPIVINEIMYNPPTGNQNEEYIELHNITGAYVTLYRTDKLTPWKFTDGIDYTFSGSTPYATIRPYGYLMVVKDLASFITRYGSMPSEVGVVYDYDGRLSNAGERLQIGMPGDFDEFGIRQYIRIDRVTYSDGSHPEDCPGGVDHWPIEADGLGKSLSRIDPNGYGNDVSNWKASLPSPGIKNP